MLHTFIQSLWWRDHSRAGRVLSPQFVLRMKLHPQNYTCVVMPSSNSNELCTRDPTQLTHCTRRHYRLDYDKAKDFSTLTALLRARYCNEYVYKYSQVKLSKGIMLLIKRDRHTEQWRNKPSQNRHPAKEEDRHTQVH